MDILELLEINIKMTPFLNGYLNISIFRSYLNTGIVINRKNTLHNKLWQENGLCYESALSSMV